jgi:WD40 repeat protein
MASWRFGFPGVAGMLVGPAAKENNGSSHCSSHGLLAYGAGSSIVIVDVRSMQLVTVLPMPCAGSTAFQAAPFVTAIQWNPEGLQSDLLGESATSNLRLAVGDRQGRIAIWNVANGEISTWLSLEADKGRLGIQDVCWVYGQPWLLLAIHGTSLVSLWDTATGRSIWRLDASPEVLSCVKCDPFDARQVCIVSAKGLLLSIYIGGLLEFDISVKRHQLNVAEERGGSTSISGAGKGSNTTITGDVGKDGVSGLGMSYSANSAGTSQTLLSGNNSRCLFSTTSRGILYITFPRELFVFDLRFGAVLSNSGLPRGCSRFLDLVANADGDVLYCAHADGKLTAWLRKQWVLLVNLLKLSSVFHFIGWVLASLGVLNRLVISFAPRVECTNNKVDV